MGRGHQSRCDAESSGSQGKVVAATAGPKTFVPLDFPNLPPYSKWRGQGTPKRSPHVSSNDIPQHWATSGCHFHP
jgi:hypothetical protein